MSALCHIRKSTTVFITCWRGRAADVDCLCCNLVNPHYERIGRLLASYDAINYSWLCVLNNALESDAEKPQLSKIGAAPAEPALTPIFK